jgi:prevent-host-death family protein
MYGMKLLNLLDNPSPVLYNIIMVHLSAAQVRKNFSNLIKETSRRKNRMVITRYGHTLAAIVPVEDLDLLEKMEDQRDAEIARKAIKEMKTKHQKPIPWNVAKKQLGL